MTDSSFLVALLVTPVVTGVLCRLVRRLRWTEGVNAVGAVATLALAAVVVVRVVREGALSGLGGLLYVDALSALMIATIAGVGCAAALVSVGYLRRDVAARHVPGGERGARWYYCGLQLFVWSMLATVSVDNVGLLWVGIEATTFASALLVGFYRTKPALEAAWKYLILCTVGITFALFGVLLTYYAAIQAGEEGAASLDWTNLAAGAGRLDPAMMRLAFVFVLVGFGTKAGFAPLHTWLADAHSQAPSPVSGLLSGVLLSCALYGILRFHAITVGSAGAAFSSRLLIGFGLLSVAVAVPFIVVQRDLKRLLAYSSVEHVGLMAIAFGIGGALGIYAGLLHLVNHAITKSLLFFVAGDLGQRYGTRRINAIRGAIRAAPVAGWGLLAGVVAITGIPPFGIFVSELAIAGAGFRDGRLEAAVVTVVILFLGTIFAGMLAHALHVLYGTPPVQAAGAQMRPGRDLASLAALVPLAALMILFGLYVPDAVNDLFDQVTTVLEPATATALR